jgi:hypothetical protein
VCISVCLSLFQARISVIEGFLPSPLATSSLAALFSKALWCASLIVSRKFLPTLLRRWFLRVPNNKKMAQRFV